MRHDHRTDRTRPGPSAWQATLSGFCASLVGIGLARFAYTPLLPAIIEAHWFAASAAAYLGAANLAGYLAGAILARPAAACVPSAVVLRAMMLLASAAFFACAWPVSFSWFFLWRFAAGLSGGALMVLAAPTVLPIVPPARRGFASGLIFTGVGIGIAASGTLVPVLLAKGLSQAWIGLGILSACLTALAWRGWPAEVAPSPAPAVSRAKPASLPLRALYAEYALNAAGLVPHMIFLVDYVTRGLGQGLQAGAGYWVLFGLGASVGPLLSGHLADRAGFGPALRLAFLVQACAIAIPTVSAGPIGLTLSSLVVGAFTPGIVPLVLGRIHELLPNDATAQKRAWSAATASFAVMQAIGAYGLSFLFAQSGGDYSLLFILGAAAVMLALGTDLAVALIQRRSAPPVAERDAAS